MTNVKNNMIYTDKLQLSVVELNHIELATEEDRLFEIDKWAAFFKAKTWKELKVMAANQYMESAVNTIFELSSDKNIRELCRRRHEFEADERHTQEKLAEKDAVIIESNTKAAKQEAELVRLRKRLDEAGIDI